MYVSITKKILGLRDSEGIANLVFEIREAWKQGLLTITEKETLIDLMNAIVWKKY